MVQVTSYLIFIITLCDVSFYEAIFTPDYNNYNNGTSSLHCTDDIPPCRIPCSRQRAQKDQNCCDKKRFEDRDCSAQCPLINICCRFQGCQEKNRSLFDVRNKPRRRKLLPIMYYYTTTFIKLANIQVGPPC